MFNYKGTEYTLKFNTQKLKTIEMVAKKSVVGEIANNNGILQMQTLEAVFSLALIEETTNEVVKQKKAAKMFEGILEEHGFFTVNNMVIEKLQEDLGFMFR